MPGSLAPLFSASRIRWKAAGVQSKRIHSREDRKKRPATGRDEDYAEYAPEKKGRENKPPQIHRPDGAAPQRFFHIADTAFDGDGACKTSLLFQCGKTRRTFQKGGDFPLSKTRRIRDGGRDSRPETTGQTGSRQDAAQRQRKALRRRTVLQKKRAERIPQSSQRRCADGCKRSRWGRASRQFPANRLQMMQMGFYWNMSRPGRIMSTMLMEKWYSHNYI